MANRNKNLGSIAAKVVLKIVAAGTAFALGLAALVATYCATTSSAYVNPKGVSVVFALLPFVLWLAYFIFSRGVLSDSLFSYFFAPDSYDEPSPICTVAKAPHLIEDLTDVDKSELATCPNCSGVIRLRSAECMHCRAVFGETSVWKIEPLVK